MSHLEQRPNLTFERGLTIVELLLVITILAVLTSMGGLVFRGMQERADVGKCMSHMRGLHQAAGLYIADHDTWPYADDVSPANEEAWGRAWQNMFEPYDIDPGALVCPSNQRKLNNPDLTRYPRIDYLATPFSGGRWAPYRWARQPWFVEIGDFHGNGNLVIFPDGHIDALKEIVR